VRAGRLRRAKSGIGDALSCSKAAAGTIERRRGLAYCEAALERDNLSVHEEAATLVNRGILRMKAAAASEAERDFDAALRLEPDIAEARHLTTIGRRRSSSPAGGILASSLARSRSYDPNCNCQGGVSPLARRRGGQGQPSLIMRGLASFCRRRPLLRTCNSSPKKVRGVISSLARTLVIVG
jgi:hypothetical protein